MHGTLDWTKFTTQIKDQKKSETYEVSSMSSCQASTGRQRQLSGRTENHEMGGFTCIVSRTEKTEIRVFACNAGQGRTENHEMGRFTCIVGRTEKTDISVFPCNVGQRAQRLEYVHALSGMSFKAQ